MKKMILGVIAIVLIGGGYIGYTMWDSYAPKSYIQEDGTTLNTTTNTVSTTTKTFTMTEVATHASEDSCYSVIQNKVYDLTLFIKAHPGGSKPILSICGVDGTEKFMNKHKGGQKFMDILKRFHIGNVQ